MSTSTRAQSRYSYKYVPLLLSFLWCFLSLGSSFVFKREKSLGARSNQGRFLNENGTIVIPLRSD